MVDISIVDGGYKLTNITGGYHIFILSPLLIWLLLYWWIPIQASPSHCSSWILSTGYMRVSIAMEVPLSRWMVYDGKSYWNGWLGVTPFVETPRWLGVMIGYACSLRTDTWFSNFWEAAHYPGQAQHTKPGSTASQDPGFPPGPGGWEENLVGKNGSQAFPERPSGRIIVHQGWLVLLQW